MSVWGNLWSNLKKPGYKRLILLFGLLVFIIGISAGFLEHEHHGQEHLHYSIFSEKWLNLIFAGLSLITLIFTLFSTRHFIEEHIWNHIVKHHFLKILLWTFGTLLVIHFLVENLDITRWINEQYWVVLLLAILIGIIPTSGPSSCFRYPLCHRDYSFQHTSGQQYCSGRPCRAAPAGRNKKRLCSCQSLKDFSCAVGNSRYPVYWFMVIRNSSLSCVLTNRSFMNSIASTEFMSAR